jgi:hypothetical protein
LYDRVKNLTIKAYKENYLVVFQHEVEHEAPECCEVNVQFSIRSGVGWGQNKTSKRIEKSTWILSATA